MLPSGEVGKLVYRARGLRGGDAYNLCLLPQAHSEASLGKGIFAQLRPCKVLFVSWRIKKTP